jgi:hydrogenase nickel incorporation protein HypA/HybF
MHETAVVSGIIGILERSAVAERIERITTVRIKVGRLRGLDVRQLVGAFEVMAEGTRAEGATLIVDEVAVSAHCPACEETFETKGWNLACPKCGSSETQIVAGRELHVENFDGTREAPDREA